MTDCNKEQLKEQAVKEAVGFLRHEIIRLNTAMEEHPAHRKLYQIRAIRINELIVGLTQQ